MCSAHLHSFTWTVLRVGVLLSLARAASDSSVPHRGTSRQPQTCAWTPQGAFWPQARQMAVLVCGTPKASSAPTSSKATGAEQSLDTANSSLHLVSDCVHCKVVHDSLVGPHHLRHRERDCDIRSMPCHGPCGRSWCWASCTTFIRSAYDTISRFCDLLLPGAGHIIG